MVMPKADAPMPINLTPDAETRALIARNRAKMVVALLAMAVAAYFLVSDRGAQRYDLTISAGAAEGRRHELARILASVAEAHGISIRVVPTEGSIDAVNRVARGELDLALVQGGLDPVANVTEATSLYPEPLHLLMRSELAAGGARMLRGRTVSLSTPGSGTHRLAREALAFLGLDPKLDIVERDVAYDELRALPPAELPDALFMVSSLPSGPASFLIRERGYELVPLPVGKAMAIRDFRVEEAAIPAFTYGYVPPAPPEQIATIGNQLLIVANADVPRRAVSSLLEVVYEGAFAREASLRALSPPDQSYLPEFPLHPGARSFLEREKPLITSEVIDNVESMRSFIVSTAIALFLLWQWYVRRQSLGFEAFIDEVTRIEREALMVEKRAEMDLVELMRIRQRLSEIKNDALEKFARGELKGEELMASFLTHVTDVRNYLNALILHARERIEKAASRGEGTPKDVGNRLEEMWERALGDLEEK